MAKFQKREVWTYDEPMTYSDFNGGINTDQSNENLLDNELKDAINFNYNSTVLEKRFGAKMIKRFDVSLEEKALMTNHAGEIINQGTFLFGTQYNTYLVFIRNGRIFYGVISENEVIPVGELYIDMSKYFFDEEFSGELNPKNVSLGLNVTDVDPTLVKSNGHIKRKTIGSKTYYQLILQNYRPIEGAIYDYKLYLATGTRFLVIEDIEGELVVSCIDPKETYGTEQELIGFNYLSPFPEHIVANMTKAPKTAISNIRNTNLVSTPGTHKFSAVMTYAMGKTAGDYRFRWEVSTDGGINYTRLTQYRDPKSGEASQPVTGKGLDTLNITLEEGKTYTIRCSFAGSFKSSLNPDDKKYYYDEEPNGIDWVVNNADGEWFGQAAIQLVCSSADKLTINQQFLNINSCTKLTADGNKFLLYDDLAGTGNWYKTVIGKPNYITDRGNLNFQTGKKEKVINVSAFKGVLVVFANNENLGGNVSIVSGNGDDVSTDQYYSPYQRKVVNTKTTCDNSNSVQMTDNFLMFKYGDTVYLLDSSDLNNELINFQSANDRLKPKNRTIHIPWGDQDYYTEITDDYYGIIWKEKFDMDGNKVREGQRLKLYYKFMTRIDNSHKYYFPWLRDISPIFSEADVIMLKGISTFVTAEGKLLQFTSTEYTDDGYVYPISLKLRGVDLGYPKLGKFMQKIILYYYRDQTDIIRLHLTVRNEAGFKLFERKPKAAYIDDESVKWGHKDLDKGVITSAQDKRVLVANETILEDDIRLDATTMDVITCIPPYRFPFLVADAEISMQSPQSFSISSITYDYVTTDVPQITNYDLYARIIRDDLKD